MSFSFSYVDTKEELLQALKRELPKHNFSKVKIIKADPQSHTEIPCIGINRISDDESHESLVDSHGTAYDRDKKEYTDFYGTFFQESMEIRVWHTNADERNKLYIVVKAVLFGLRTELVDKGLLNVTLRGGRDEQDTSQAQAPIPLYWSTLTLSYLNPMDVQFVQQNVEAITQINGHATLRSEPDGRGNTE